MAGATARHRDIVSRYRKHGESVLIEMKLSHLKIDLPPHG